MGSVDICGKKMREWNKRWKVEQQQKKGQDISKSFKYCQSEAVSCEVTDLM